MVNGDPAKTHAVSVVASGFAQLLASQISTRLVTFSLNLLIARHLSPEAFGLLAIQFHLILTIIIVLSRDGFRRGCLRLGAADGQVDARTLLSVAWLVIPVGAVVATAVCSVVLLSHRDTGPEADVYRTAVLLHGAAAFLEVLPEPFAILAAARLQFRVKVVVEALSTIARCVVTYLLVVHTQWHVATVFSVAQLVLAAVTALGYGAYGIHSMRGGASRPPTPRRPGWGPAQKDALWMTGLFTLQAAEKLVLSDTSKFVMVALQSRYNQGVFGLVTNLGALVVRTVFQPLEEVAFTAFSRFGSKKPSDAALTQLAQALGALVKCVTVLGLLAVAFGPAYSYTLLRLLYSLKWSETEAPVVLACYCAYVLLVAVNGVTEAFVHAVLDRRSLQQSNALLIVFGAAHLAISVVAVRAAGATGLVLADAANMALRITYSMWYIRRYFGSAPGFRLSSLMPTSTTILGCAMAAAAVWASCRAFMSGVNGQTPTRVFLHMAGLHVAAGVAVLGVLGAVVYQAERATFRSALSLRHGGAATAPGEKQD